MANGCFKHIIECKRLRTLLQYLSVFVVSRNEVSIGMIDKHFFQHSFTIKAIAWIHKDRILSFRNGNSFIHAIIYTLIALTDPVINTALVWFYNLLAAIGWAPVYYDELIIFEPLTDNALDRGLEAGFVIEIYCYYRDFHCFLTILYNLTKRGFAPGAKKYKTAI